jgi:hypothetical protein
MGEAVAKFNNRTTVEIFDLPSPKGLLQVPPKAVVTGNGRQLTVGIGRALCPANASRRAC